MSNRITTVRLLAVPLENDYLHTLYFDSKSAQTNYFMSRPHKQYDDFSYQRKDHVIRFPVHIDDLIGYNYVMYKNSAYSDKWFYAFIVKMEYVNDANTNITIETDVIQTWLFNADGSEGYKVKPSFIEREHVNDDTIGKHTIPEQLETGDYVCNEHTRDENLDELYIVIGVTSKADGTRVGGFNYNGVYSGVFYYACPATKANLVTEFLNQYDEGKIDAIQCVFLAPKFIVANDTFDGVQGVVNSSTARSYSILKSKPDKVGKYTPRNNKLLTNPYTFLYVSNNNGGCAVYPYEYFSTDIVEFTVQGAVTPSCSIRLTPLKYKGSDFYDEEGINLGKFPICNWSSDVYTNWLTQNSLNIGTSVATGISQIIAGVAITAGTGGLGGIVGAGTIVGGVGAIAGTMGQVYSHAIQPAQANGNINCGDVITSSGRNSFHFYQMSIKEEYAKIIDGYFDMFGYKVNRVGTPLKDHRLTYWYTKTIDVNIDGNIPMEDLQKIKQAYNSGITFWKNAMSIGLYQADNPITKPEVVTKGSA